MVGGALHRCFLGEQTHCVYFWLSFLPTKIISISSSSTSRRPPVSGSAAPDMFNLEACLVEEKSKFCGNVPALSDDNALRAARRIPFHRESLSQRQCTKSFLLDVILGVFPDLLNPFGTVRINPDPLLRAAPIF